MNQTVDPRLGLPSGSSALEDSLCRRRWRAQKEWDELTGGRVEEEPEEGNPDDLDENIQAGKRIHKLYAGEDCPGATQAERVRAEQAILVDAKMNAKWLDQLVMADGVQVIELREHRWWYKDDSGQQLYSGQTDLVRIAGKIGGDVDILIADLKGLWGHHDEAAINMQIRRYIALIAYSIEDLGYARVNSAFAYLNQPAKTMSPEWALYTRDDINQAIFQMQWDVSELFNPDAEAVAGPVQCAHCRAKLMCPAFQKHQAETELQTMLPHGAEDMPVQKFDPPTKMQIESKLNALPGDKLAWILRWLKAYDNMIQLAKAEAKRRLRNDLLSVPGWQIKKNSPRSRVDNLMELWTRLEKAYAMPASEFIKLCTITKTNVEQLSRQKSGLKGKALDAKVKELLDGCTSEINVSDGLEEV